jgi:hypothetical protein
MEPEAELLRPYVTVHCILSRINPIHNVAFSNLKMNIGVLISFTSMFPIWLDLPSKFPI